METYSVLTLPARRLEYDGAVTELHAAMPEGVTDPYTPNGIADPIKPEEGADIGNDHTTSAGWHPSYF